MSVKHKADIKLITMGCSKNLVDSEHILGQLQVKGLVLTHDEDADAPTVIINTCGFIQDAKQESIDMILRYARERQQGNIRELLVFGCLSERYSAELRIEIPEVDAWFGAGEPRALFSWLNHSFKKASTARVLATPSHYAYLKISEGCNRSCSFCAIPAIRGRHRSVPIDQLVDEARLLAGRGVRELLLVAQDLSEYGRDLNGKSQLAGLLKALLDIESVRWIRLHYAYPLRFPAEVIEMMAREERICRYLDIPLQHISDHVLKAMRRGHGEKLTRKLIHQLRQKVPGIALRTTFLVGFPGETRSDFIKLRKFVQESRFERMGVFTYSPEEGTRAWKLGETLNNSTKQRRAARLMEIQQEISLQINESRIGSVMTVVIDRHEGDNWVGRTEFDSPEVDNEVFIPYSPRLAPGCFIQARITGAGPYELFAVPLQTDPEEGH